MSFKNRRPILLADASQVAFLWTLTFGDVSHQQASKDKAYFPLDMSLCRVAEITRFRSFADRGLDEAVKAAQGLVVARPS